MKRLLATAAACCLSATAAAAAPVAVDVRGPDGRPLAGAVVTVEMPGVAAPAPRGDYAVEQKDIQFQPHVLIVPVGATVAFPNRDRVRHHVYSFSKPRKFDLKLYGREEARSVTFDKPGAVTLGCNIHDTMNGVVFVTATPFAAQTDAAGRVSFAGVPAGQATVRVWHPSIRAAGNTLAQPLAVTAAGATSHLVIRR
ncbi:methylamine utilization protein [Sphingomonas adhaesiva]|uniref:methylamine utilization protein n=1 Tax=Sphingomonas adhaesiva TaxID=28212 RepID=UPI002FF804D1